ncbi:MAG: UbiD family decarboxylase, partial [Bacillota bacterium]
MNIREWIQKIRAAGDLLEVEGADPNVELGVVADLLEQKMEGPAVLFSRLAGYPPGYRVLANTMTSMSRLALTLGLNSGLPPLSLVAAIKDRLGDVRPLAPVWVEGGPVLENVRMGDQVDLFSLPVPT